MFDRFGRSRRTRATEKLLAGAIPPTVSVCMLRNPTLTASDTLPDNRPPQDRNLATTSTDSDPAAEEQLGRGSALTCLPSVADREGTGVLKEEWPFLREEQAEPV